MQWILLYGYFLVSAIVALMGLGYLIRVVRGGAVLAANGTPTPTYFLVYMLGLGVFGMLASAPSIFSDNPHWFSDKIFFVVSKVIGLFA